MKVPTKYASVSTEDQIRKLKEAMKEDPSSRLRMRAHSILLSSRNYSIDEIADIYEVDRDTASNWITVWEESGFEGLQDKPISGRPPILDEKEKELVEKSAEEDPRSVKRVVEEVKKETKKEVSASTIKRILKRAGKIWKRVRASLKSKRNEAEFQECKAEIEDLEERAYNGEIDLYYFDAAGFCLDPCIPYAWQNEGETIEIPAATRGRINVLGFMNTDNNLESFMFQGSIDAHVIVGCFNIFGSLVIGVKVTIYSVNRKHTG